MDEATSVVFEMEKASTGTTNDSASKVCRIEEASTGPKSLNADIHLKMLVSPFHKVSMSRKGITSISIKQMTLLDQMDPRRLKQIRRIKKIVTLMCAKIAMC